MPTSEVTSGIESKVTVNASASGTSLVEEEYNECIYFDSDVLEMNTLTRAKKKCRVVTRNISPFYYCESRQCYRLVVFKECKKE